jgi:hypothetical protein
MSSPKFSVSKFFNYIQKDYIIDWLNLYASKYNYKKQKRNTFFMDAGTKLEHNIKDVLSKDLPSNEFVDLTQFLFKNYTHEEQTKKYLMADDTQCVYQGFVTNNNFYGITDFIVRDQLLNKWLNLYSNKPISNEVNNSYSIVDVKSSCKISSEGKILRSTKNYDWLQFQLSMYSHMLSSYENVPVSNKAYIMTFKNEKITMGEIDLIKIDEDFSKSLLEYMRAIKEDGLKWSLFPVPNNDYLFPNMNNTYDDDWRDVKKDISKKIGEWTLLPYVTIKQRKELWKAGIKTFKDKDIMTKLDTVPIKLNKSMIQVNQSNVFCETKNGDKVKEILSQKINKDDALIFIDIETIYGNSNFYPFMSCVFSSKDNEHIISMCETIEDATQDMLLEYTSSVLEEYALKYQKIKVIHYSGNENRIFRQNDNIEYIDLYAILNQCQFAMTGLFSLKLKELYKCIVRNKTETEISNGFDAMNIGLKYYNTENKEEQKKYKTDLQNYIKRDVDILVDLIKYFNRY